MATEAQIIANQNNSQKSTGPKTEAGKAASSQNAVKHGLRSQDFVVAPEDTAEFEELRDELLDQIKPKGGLTGVVFEKLLEAAWNQRRCRRAEAALRRELGRDPMQDPAGLKRLATIDRYTRRADRAFQAALKELRQLQTEAYYRSEVEVDFEALDLSSWGVADMRAGDKAYQRWAKHPSDMQYRQLTNEIHAFELAKKQHNAQTKPIAA